MSLKNSFFFFINWGRKKLPAVPVDKKDSNGRIIILPGSVEVTLPRNDMVALNLDSPLNIKSSLQGIINQINSKNGLAILSHPSYLLKPYNRRKLFRLDGYLGIEIYNPNKIPWPESTRRWDFLLVRKFDRKIWGFTSDDMHDLKRDAGRAWIMVRTEVMDVTGILEALKRGSFYSTTGPLVEEIINRETSIYLHLKSPAQIKYIRNGHKVCQINFGKESTYYFSPDDKYVRIEIKDLKNRKKAWTQPIFAKDGKVTYFPYFGKGEWLKGCIHIHTETDGGTASLEEVIGWYKTHGYHFLAITEHNFIAHPKFLSEV
ncbi:MAG: hypothetical protein NC818_05500 [Candidatus Omnitrophica bacterium]|nr:hypothetical protein [Candidatus Omnitrophota bacterium]